MEEEKSYYHFLQNFYNEELYIIQEPLPNVALHPDKPQNSFSDQDTIAVIPEKGDEKLVFVMQNSLAEDINNRFQSMLEKLGLSKDDVNIIDLSSFSYLSEIGKLILNMAPEKIVLLGSKNCIPNLEMKDEFSQVNVDDKSILILPDFTEIVQKKDLVLQCWEELQKFTEGS